MAGYQFYNEKPQRLKKTWSGMARNEGGDVDKNRLTVTESGKVETKISKSVTAKVEGGFPSVQGQPGRAVRPRGREVDDRDARPDLHCEGAAPAPGSRALRRLDAPLPGARLSKTNPHPGEPPRLWPVFPPPNCGLYVVADFTTTVATPERGFQKSKPRRITD